jgi:hypothetical protein
MRVRLKRLQTELRKLNLQMHELQVRHDTLEVQVAALLEEERDRLRPRVLVRDSRRARKQDRGAA